MGRTEFRPETITSGPLVGMTGPSTRAKWRALRSARSSTLKKCLTGIHIVRDAGCTTDFAVAAGGSFPADLGAERGESRSAATSVAPASHGAGPHADHESTASRSSQ